jgi:hypothetical protein
MWWSMEKRGGLYSHGESKLVKVNRLQVIVKLGEGVCCGDVTRKV